MNVNCGHGTISVVFLLFRCQWPPPPSLVLPLLLSIGLQLTLNADRSPSRVVPRSRTTWE